MEDPRTAPRGGPLASYRVLDLTDDRGAMCGKMFADAGADVVKIEHPNGCPTRRIPPFLDGIPGRDRGLYHLTYNAGKRSVTLDLERPEARRLFLRLVETSDFLVESFSVGYLDSLGLDYESLSRSNPRLIYLTITPFGDRGPAARYKSTDIISWASGGMMYLSGIPGRPPLQMSLPQAGLHAGAEAAVAGMLAHLERERSSEGQRVVIDTQACVVWTMLSESPYPLLHGDVLRRSGVKSGGQRVSRTLVYPCNDGHVMFLLTGGAYSHSAEQIVEWMEEEGAAPDWIKAVDFSTWSPEKFSTDLSDEFVRLVGECEDVVTDFFSRFSRQEIYRVALERGLMIAPVATVEDIAVDEQLAAREYFQTAWNEALDRELTYVGPFAKLSAAPLARVASAPQLGQDNEVVLGEELGLRSEELQYLYATSVI